MVKPTAEQCVVLQELRTEVLFVMSSMDLVEPSRLTPLEEIPLGVLRTSATQRHGVTRWRRRSGKEVVVECVDMHPKLLESRWTGYARFVLYHEFLHALGWKSHNAEFRQQEAKWPEIVVASQGRDFTQAMRKKRARWLWSCPTCQQELPRQRKASGRYLCRGCRTVLLDIPVDDTL